MKQTKEQLGQEELLIQQREKYIAGLPINEYHNCGCPVCGGGEWSKAGPMGPQDEGCALMKVRCNKCESLYVTYVPIY